MQVLEPALQASAGARTATVLDHHRHHLQQRQQRRIMPITLLRTLSTLDQAGTGRGTAAAPAAMPAAVLTQASVLALHLQAEHLLALQLAGGQRTSGSLALAAALLLAVPAALNLRASQSPAQALLAALLLCRSPRQRLAW